MPSARAAGAQLLTEAAGELLARVVRVGGDEHLLIVGERLQEVGGQTRTCAIGDRNNARDPDPAQGVEKPSIWDNFHNAPQFQ